MLIAILEFTIFFSQKFLHFFFRYIESTKKKIEDFVVHAIPVSSTPSPRSPKQPKILKPIVKPQRIGYRINSNNANASMQENCVHTKPAYSYAFLIALALKNNTRDNMQVGEVYKFITKHFPYYRNAPSEWQNSVRHCLHFNNFFRKTEIAIIGNSRPRYQWSLCPSKIEFIDKKLKKITRKNCELIKKSMQEPDLLEAMELGHLEEDFCESSEKDDIMEYTDDEMPMLDEIAEDYSNDQEDSDQSDTEENSQNRGFKAKCFHCDKVFSGNTDEFREHVEAHSNDEPEPLMVKVSPAKVRPKQPSIQDGVPRKEYIKPALSNACLIALALKNSLNNHLSCPEVYAFCCEHFPYFETAKKEWKNSIRHAISTNKCFMKYDENHGKKGNLWTTNPQYEDWLNNELERHFR